MSTGYGSPVENPEWDELMAKRRAHTVALQAAKDRLCEAVDKIADGYSYTGNAYGFTYHKVALEFDMALADYRKLKGAE